MATRIGDAGSNSLIGTSGNDTILGLQGGDTVQGLGGSDLLVGGMGDDSIVYGSGASDTGSNLIYGDEGADTVTSAGSAGNNTILGGTGNAAIDFQAGAGDGNDVINASADTGNDLILGNFGDDAITVGGGRNTVLGGMGNDLIAAGNGGDLLYGGEGSDTITAGNGNNTIVGGTGNSAIDSMDGADLITSGSGNDLILGNGGNDTVAAGAGNDTAVGGYGDDVILGNQGDDIVLGNQGDDTLFGGFGNDTLVGGQGNDVLYGNEGNNLIIGSEGDDTAVYANPRSAYTITQDAQGDFIITGSTGIDTVSTVEHFRFGDGTVDAANLIQQPTDGGPAPTPTPTPTPTSDTYVGQETNGQITFSPSILVNDTPQGNGLAVASVSNVTATSSNGMVFVITPVEGPLGPRQVAKYQYSTGYGTDTLTISNDGFVSATFDGFQMSNSVTFDFNYQDVNANGTSTTSAHVKATVTGLEAPPVVTTSRGTLMYKPGDGAVQIDRGISVTDPDGLNLTAANVQISNNYVKGEDVLELSSQAVDKGGNLFILSSTNDNQGYKQVLNSGYDNNYVKFDVNTGTLMIKGVDTHGHYEDLLDAVAYTDTSKNPSPATRTVTFTGADEFGVSSAGATDTIVFTPTAVPNSNPLRAAIQPTVESAPSSGNSYVFTPHAGHQTVAGFIVGGTDHDTLSLKRSDFGNRLAKVLHNTIDTAGGAVIFDPVTNDIVRVAGVTKDQLASHPGDFKFHA